MAMEIRLGVKVERGVRRGEEYFFILREPTAAELGAFRLRRKVYLQQGAADFVALWRAEFFDLLLQRVENFNDDDKKPITPARKNEIPGKWKNQLIFSSFENPKDIAFLKKLGVHYAID